MVWQPEIEELKRRQAFAEKMGGEAGISEQRKRGKLTVRERIDLLSDAGSFREIGQLAGAATYDGNELVDVRPSNMVIGVASLNGRKAVLTAGDFTVRGGASDAAIGNKSGHAQRMALDWRLPYIRLLDATGGSVRTFEQIGRTYIPTNPTTPGVQDLLCRVPVVAAVLGSVAGLPAVDSCLAHFNVMVKGTSQVFPGGPPVVKAALGVDITKEDLGDERSQVYEKRCHRQPGRDRGRGVRHDQAVPVLPAGQRLGGCRRGSTPATIRTAGDETLLDIIPRGQASGLRSLQDHRRRPRQGFVLRDHPVLRALPHRWACPGRRLPRRRHDQQPETPGWLHGCFGGHKGHPLPAALRHLPPADDLPGGRAWIHGGA